MRPKNFFRDALIVSGISLALLLAGELLLRTIYPEEVLPASAYDRTVYQFDPDILVSLKPNMESTFKRSKDNGGDVIHWSTNSLGFRGKELRPDPGIRIIVYGDSNIQASFSLLEDSFPYRLEKELQALTKKDVEVINGGIVGTGPDQSLLRMRREIDLHEPDIVVFHVFADNDFGDLIRNRLFDLDPSGNLLLSEHERTVDESLIRAYDRSFLSAMLTVRAAGKVWNAVRPGNGTHDPGRMETGEQMLGYLLSENERQFAVYQSGEPRKYSHFADLYDADVAVFPESESATTKIGLMDAVLREARDTAQSRDVRFFVVIQPSQIDLTKNSMLSYEDLSKYPDYRQDNLSRIVENILARRRIDGINLFHAFSDQVADELYFKGEDDHWNDAGQLLAAQVTAQRLSSVILDRSR
jgi:hypothetical protein